MSVNSALVLDITLSRVEDPVRNQAFGQREMSILRYVVD